MEDVDAFGGGAVSPAVLDAFGFEGVGVRTEPLAGGHIHRNFLVTCSAGRFVLQQVNDKVFPDVEAVLCNVQRVVAHLKGRGRRCPELVETRSGELSFPAADASRWRAFRYLEGTVGRSTPAGPADAFEAARAFGDYLVAMVDFPGPPLAKTIDRFHDLDHRLDALDAVAAADRVGRRAGVRHELDRARGLGRDVMEAIRARSRCPSVRIVHNDAKLSNVRFDAETGLASCVIDLDTTMAGQVAYDIGELVRTAATHAPEDAADEATVDFDLELLDALSSGYFAAGPPLEWAEVDSMSVAGPHMAIENALRFLTDHLAGDRYFGLGRAGQNLDRCRTQLVLTEMMLETEAESRACFARAARSTGAAWGGGPDDAGRAGKGS